MKLRNKILIYGLVVLGVWFLSTYILLASVSVERHIEHADAIVVLGGSADYKKRTDTAANLWKTGAAPKVIITDDGQRGGWDTTLERNPSFAERAVKNLIGRGVAAIDIEVLPTVVASTRDEAELVSNLALDRNYRSVILVTSSFHTRRALWMFQRVATRRDLQITYGIESPDADKSMYFKLFWSLDSRNIRNIPVEIVKLVYYWNVYS